MELLIQQITGTHYPGITATTNHWYTLPYFISPGGIPMEGQEWFDINFRI